jgi:hypothetical protein
MEAERERLRECRERFRRHDSSGRDRLSMERRSVRVSEVYVKRLCGPQGGWIIAPDELARPSDL